MAATPAPTPVAEWSALAFDRPERPAGLEAITLLDDRLVAVGTAGHAGAAWVLDPGGEWRPATEVPPPPGEREIVVLNDVDAGPSGLVALGWLGIQQSDAFETVIWTSPDGETWTEAQRIEGTLLASVAAGAAGYVGVGGPGGVTGPQSLEVWTSPDGTEWSDADIDPSAMGTVISIIAYDGGFLAVGTAEGEDAQGSRVGVAAVWTSPDGLAWSEAWRETSAQTILFDVVATNDRLLAVGQIHQPVADPAGAGTSVPAAWGSTDGTAWEATPFEPESAMPSAVAAGDGGFVAAGVVGDDPLEQQLAVWTSGDGASWSLVEQVAQQPPGSLRDVIILPGRVVAVGALTGEDRNGTTRQPVVVTGPPP